MPITLPNSPTSHSFTTDRLTLIARHALPTFDFSAPCGIALAIILSCRLFNNILQFFIPILANGRVGEPQHNIIWFAFRALFSVADQVVVGSCVRRIAEATGSGGWRKVFGRVWVEGRHFEVFLFLCGVLHVGCALWIAFVVLVSMMFPGAVHCPDGLLLTCTGLVIAAVAWVAARPEEEEVEV